MLEDHHLYKAAIEHSPIGIGLCAPEGRFLDVNRALCALTGHEAQTLRTRGLFDLCHPDHTERARDSVEALLSGQREALSMETRFVRQDGSTVWVQADLALAHEDSGASTSKHLIVQVQDVTARRLALESLRASEQRLSYVLDGAGLGTFDWSTRARHVSFNRRTADMLGYDPEDLPNDPDAWFSMVHPQDAALSARRIYRHLRGDVESFEVEQRMRGSHGQWIWIAARGRVTERDARGMATRVSGTLLDVTKRRAMLDQAHHLALHDPLTDLPNARLLRDRLFVAIQAARRARGQVAVVFIDLDRFKPVNDEYGHGVGDLVLKATAMRLRSGLRASDTVARLGGDEFVAILTHCATRDDVEQTLERLINELQAPFRVEGHVLSMGVSAGVALYPADGHDAHTLIRNADAAMYEVKRAGGNGFGFHASLNYERLMGMRSRDRDHDLDGEADAR
ncbi:diguanylate cyclase domain protein [Ralstonia insidiosa]|uniref:Diguanylate cyclase domain protein n=2 Tax=Pseudomonadota TaxID=1224 RepID=A0AAC9BMH9_9RALS|nr:MULTISPECIES: diguanylate cyclase [Ralstonia]ANH76963.1 diguanylate cyclase domain protein [Ralstonia insidiosa]EPX99729.1 diguanylate cyclase [Ralstonia sp. AU12-08]MBY4705550.1 diguanylate cyclase [Ralstonia insidiosa]GAQ29783.1 PAS/PAC sensor-containing diguanylate cyclase [Ralstonia sp. NT80]